MDQIQQLVNTLKQQLRAHGVTYADVAKSLDLSEASVKRLFARQQFTLQRLAEVCAMIDLDLADLMQLSNANRARLQQLSADQEQEIVADLPLLLIAISVINGYQFDELIADLELDKHECIAKLAQLDRLRIIDLLPNNRIKLLIAPNFRWRIDGPIQRYFQEEVAQAFFRTRFDSSEEKLLVMNGLLSTSGNDEIQHHMDRLANEFNSRAQLDRSLPLDERHGNTLVVAIRRWRYNRFEMPERTPG